MTKVANIEFIMADFTPVIAIYSPICLGFTKITFSLYFIDSQAEQSIR